MKYEYKYVKKVYVTKTEGNDEDDMALAHYLNQMGDDGWELVSFNEDGAWKTFIWKRPK